MKKYSVIISVIFINILLFTSACKKTASKSSADSNFSFTYNGIHYVLPFKEGYAEWSFKNSGILINRPDLFKGIIYFPYANCAYLEPNNTLIIQSATNCELTDISGLSIDSVSVYLYQSGSVNISYKNCSRKSQYDPYSGSTISYDVCDADGTFDLTLKNKENKTITITEGRLEAYGFQR
jgi:hypothetical protein